ncbi:MAG TPA: hypothetical protein VIN40_02910 [Candidatus Tyrphobacter sp.]
MFYVEWLRVRNALRIVAIVLGVMFALVVILRITLGSPAAQYDWIFREAGKPGVHVSQQRQSDGALRTTIDDPAKGDHIVIVDRGWHGKDITITGPGVYTDQNNVQVGSVGVHGRHVAGGSDVVQINTDEPITARILLSIASFIALIVGTVLAAPLSKENADHLEIAWTKPLSRTGMALGMFAVDAAGIIASMALSIIFTIASIALFELPIVVIDSQTLPVLALCVLMPLAWYALLTAASASMKRGRGAVLGLGWLAALIVPSIGLGLSAAPIPVFHALGVAFSVLTVLDPIAYLHLSMTSSPGNAEPTIGFAFGVLSSPALVRAAILLLLAAAYSALSLLQWRRLEA